MGSASQRRATFSSGTGWAGNHEAGASSEVSSTRASWWARSPTCRRRLLLDPTHPHDRRPRPSGREGIPQRPPPPERGGPSSHGDTHVPGTDHRLWLKGITSALPGRLPPGRGPLLQSSEQPLPPGHELLFTVDGSGRVRPGATEGPPLTNRTPTRSPSAQGPESMPQLRWRVASRHRGYQRKAPLAGASAIGGGRRRVPTRQPYGTLLEGGPP